MYLSRTINSIYDLGKYRIRLNEFPTAYSQIVSRYSNYDYSEFAIIIQGPLYQFTLDSVKFYKKFFPNIKIVLVVWEDEESKIIDSSLKNDDNLHIVIAEIPITNLVRNHNLMIKSTQEGLKYAKYNLEVKYAVKLRSDIRIHANDCLITLSLLLKTFKVNKNSPLSSRIIVDGHGTGKFRPYCLSDVFQFGKVDDIYRYWDVPLWEEGIKIFIDHPKFNNYLIDDCPIFSESYICSTYLMNNGYNPSWELDDWWNVVKRDFITVDYSLLDLLWYKEDSPGRNIIDTSFDMKGYSYEFNLNITFSDWIKMYYDLENVSWKNGSKEKYFNLNKKSYPPVYDLNQRGGTMLVNNLIDNTK
jgi:hypothetical protein